MQRDEHLALSLAAGGELCTVRVYGWRPPAISLGWHQSTEEIELDRCTEAGIDVVRRPTGGRAILHSDEVTYSVVMIANRTSVLGVYQRISEALVCGLRSVGVDASLEKSQPHFPSLYGQPSSMACFASAARYEIQVDGRKLVGSAQRRFARADGLDVVLQHGSILLGPDHLRIVDFLRLPSHRDIELLRRELEEKTIDLSSVLGRKIEFEEAALAVRAGFEESWGIEFQSIASDHVPTTMPLLPNVQPSALL